MNQAIKLQLTGMEHSRQFMDAEKYQAFAERFQAMVSPTLDRLREARIRSEEDAKRHLVR